MSTLSSNFLKEIIILVLLVQLINKNLICESKTTKGLKVTVPSSGNKATKGLKVTVPSSENKATKGLSSGNVTKSNGTEVDEEESEEIEKKVEKAGIFDKDRDDRFRALSVTKPVLIFHTDYARVKGDADGFYAINDQALEGDRKQTESELGISGKVFLDAQQRALVLLREVVNQKSCGTSVATCDVYTPMWPQVNGLCDLFFVKCLVEVAGLICRGYSIQDLFKNLYDLCENVSDFCHLNREATMHFCASHVFQKFGEVTMPDEPEENTWFGKLRDAII